MIPLILKDYVNEPSNKNWSKVVWNFILQKVILLELFIHNRWIKMNNYTQHLLQIQIHVIPDHTQSFDYFCIGKKIENKL